MGWEPPAPKDLAILPEHLSGVAVAVGPDYIWPVELAGEVIQALADAGAVIVGVEAWMVDTEGIPAVVGWSDYELEEIGDDRATEVAVSRAEAKAALAEVLEGTTRDEVNHVGIDWKVAEAE